MPSAVADSLSELTLRPRAQLDRRLAGAWPIGSGALGDFETIAQRRGRAGRVQHAARAGGVGAPGGGALAPGAPVHVRGVEFVLYAPRPFRLPRAGVSVQAQHRPGAGAPRRLRPPAKTRFWFVLDTAIARERARPLAVLSAPSCAAAVAGARVVRAARRARLISALRRRRAVLAACRAWAWATQGCWLSKGDAAAWGRRQATGPGTGG
jgi:hypothetical protein